ncbi:MAG TPA: hypothetical protein VE907_14390 [Gammaproteobacteria bacterium]|nr:hypothetical protein [Gammaproteobacteria bacterium]
MIARPRPRRARGGYGDDTLIGGTGGDSILTGPGDDLIVFAQGDGADVVSDFLAGAGTDDVIDLRQLIGFDTFADVQAHLSDTVGGALLDFGGGDSLLLQGVTSTSLAADDFLV